MLRKTVDNLPLFKPYLLATAAAVMIFLPTWLRLAQDWLKFEQVLAHGLATALIFLGLLLVHPPRHSATTENRIPSLYLVGGLALIGVTLVWALLELVRIDTLAYLILPVGMLTVSWALLGLQRTISFAPYVLLLSLSLPFWADLVPPLVALASIVVGEWVRWFGMTALIEGNSITLPYGRLLIADGCSGIRYFAISILLAMITAILNDYRWKAWVFTVIAAMLLGLIANWVRITILVFVAYDTKMQSDLLTDHEMLGWIVYAAFILPALYFSPVRKRIQSHTAPTGQSVFSKRGIAAVLIAFLVGPASLFFAKANTSHQPEWTLNLSGYSLRPTASMPMPLSLPDTVKSELWRSGDIWVSLVQKQKTTSDEKLVPYLPPMFDRSTWQVQEQLGNGKTVYRNILSRDQVVMAQWYKVGSQKAWTYRKAKLLQIPATLTGETRFALVTIQILCPDQGCAKVFAKLEDARTSVIAEL